MARPVFVPLLIAGALLLAAAPLQAFVGAAPASLRGAKVQDTRASSVARAASGFPLDESDLAQPSSEPARGTYIFGFVYFAENFNGRIAMIFFFVLILLEYFTDKTLFALANDILGGSAPPPVV